MSLLVNFVYYYVLFITLTFSLRCKIFIKTHLLLHLNLIEFQKKEIKLLQEESSNNQGILKVCSSMDLGCSDYHCSKQLLRGSTVMGNPVMTVQSSYSAVPQMWVLRL